VKLGIERFDHVDVEFQPNPDRPQDPPGPVKVVAHELEPLPIVAGNGGGRVSGAIRDFAQTFERAFPATKLATGLSRPSDADSDSRNRLWVVRTDGEKGICCKVDDRQQYFFAPIPLATTLLSGTDPKGMEPYVGIDLDELARRFLGAIDTFFLPQYAVPAHILAAEHYKTIMKAKSDIAGLIADSVEGIAEGTGGDREQAKELLRQRMLVRLSSAYEVDTIVQIGVSVQAPFKKLDNTPETRPDYAPKFYGQPVGTLPAPDRDQAPEKLDFILSTAKIPLVDYAKSGDKPSYLTFLFDSEKVEPEQRLTLNLSYKATALEYDITDLPGVQDSKSSSWLTFIIPEKVIPDDKPIEVNIPIPIRAHPIPPTVDKQGIGSVQLSKPDPKIEETRQYGYSYQYSRMRSGHDLVYTSPRFNSNKQDPKAARFSGETRMDLFQALAKFNRVWDETRRKLALTLPKVQPGKPDANAEKALEEFTKLVSEIRDAWSRWPEDRSERYNEKYQKEKLELGDSLYVISEMANKIYLDEPWEIIVRKCNGLENDPIPAIEIEDWTQVEIDTPNRNERRFQFVADANFMTEKDVEAKLEIDNKLTRTVAFNNPVSADEQNTALEKKQAALDILNKENAWPEIRMTRNETLFGDVACVEGSSPRTNPSFVYHTPRVRFAEILKPRLECGQAIGIAMLPEKPGKNLDTATERSLKDHLDRLFKRFLESAGGDGVKRRIQLTCRYQYDLDNPSEHVDPLVITLPIVMAPPFDFAIPDGKNKTGSFPQSLTDAIKTWLEERYPSGKNSRFVFDISVYSNIGAAKLPVYRVSDLQLKLADIKDPVEENIGAPRRRLNA
jgi:hypothetical protein